MAATTRIGKTLLGTVRPRFVTGYVVAAEVVVLERRRDDLVSKFVRRDLW